MAARTPKSINEMVYDTINTKVIKAARFADALSEAGYKVTQGDEFWEVNGLTILKDGNVCHIDLRSRSISTLAKIRKVDFENYFATLEARTAKYRARLAHGNIEQRDSYFKETRRRWIDGFEDENGVWHMSRVEYYNVRVHRVQSINHEVRRYMSLKAEADGWHYGFDRLGSARRLVENLEFRIASAQAELEDARKKLAEQERKAAEGRERLDDFLASRGIRGC